MIVKMLTHVHMLVYTLWCWHTLRRRWSLKGRERMGSALLRKLSAYFLLRRWEIWRSRGSVSRWENTHGTLASGASDAASERPVQTVPGPARVRHQTTRTRRRPVRPVVSVRCAGVLRLSLRMGPVSTGRYRCLASGDPQVCGTLCAWVRCAPDCSVSGALQVTVRFWHERFRRWHVADVGAPDAGAEHPVPL